MNGFFRSFFAALLALVVFSLLLFFVLAGLVSGLTSKEEVTVGQKAILVLDLQQQYGELPQKSALSKIGRNKDVPSLSEIVSLIRHSANDSAVSAIYLKAQSNNNGFAASEEIRNAILGFRRSGKPVIAYGDMISQKAYQIASAANKIYCSPQGYVEWKGFSMQMAFLKGTLEKLNIVPQVFYAGKFKSATEPFREKQMTEANRIQSRELLDDLYTYFLNQSASARKLDTAALRTLANQGFVYEAADAVKYRLIDGLKYEDELKDELRTIVRAEKDARLNLLPVSRYGEAVVYRPRGLNKIAVITAAGNIIDGRGDQEMIGSETYVQMIREARTDNNVKAIVFRINSGGGSAIAAENLWRELTVAQQSKPVVVSFGDVAASAAYYLAANADSIFAQPNTITGSIGVFTLIPDMEQFFSNKLGVTFDEVSTSPNATALTVVRPLTPLQRQTLQTQVDTMYTLFKKRVAEGRGLSMEQVEEIAQGRVWSGQRAIGLKLVDRIGGLTEAIQCAARLAKLNEYGLREYPEARSFLDELLGNDPNEQARAAISKALGAREYQLFKTIGDLRQTFAQPQARMPFELQID
jgi:protease-4